MNLCKRLLVCEAMLARLEDALAHADEELAHATIVEEHIERRLGDLQAEQERLERKLMELKAETPSNVPPAKVFKEPTRALHDVQPLTVLRELKAAQEQLIRSLEVHRPSAEVITVNFVRKRKIERQNVPAHEECGAA